MEGCRERAAIAWENGDFSEGRDFAVCLTLVSIYERRVSSLRATVLSTFKIILSVTKFDQRNIFRSHRTNLENADTMTRTTQRWLWNLYARGLLLIQIISMDPDYKLITYLIIRAHYFEGDQRKGYISLISFDVQKIFQSNIYFTFMC